jgi:hypothetical protein
VSRAPFCFRTAHRALHSRLRLRPPGRRAGRRTRPCSHLCDGTLRGRHVDLSAFTLPSVSYPSADAVQGSVDSHAAPSASMRSRTLSRTTCLACAVRHSCSFSPSSSNFRAGSAGGTEHAPVQARPAPDGAADGLEDGMRLTRALAQRRCAGDARACVRLALVAVPPVTADAFSFSAAGPNGAPRERGAQHFTQLRWLGRSLVLTPLSFDVLDEPGLCWVGERGMLIPRYVRRARGPRGTCGLGEARDALRRLLACCARTLLLARAHAPPPPVRAALLPEGERCAEAAGWRRGCSTGGART